MNYELLSKLLYKYIRLQNTRFISVFDYIMEVAKVFSEVQSITLYLKNREKFTKIPILGNTQKTNLTDEIFVTENTGFLT